MIASMRGRLDRPRCMSFLCALAREHILTMAGVRDMLRAGKNMLSLIDCLGCTMYEKHEFVAFECDFILHNAVVGNANASEASAYSTDAADYDRTLKACDDPGDERTSHENRPKTGDREHCRTE
jgi:hypothetical protein